MDLRPIPCPLCASDQTAPRANLHGRDYWACSRCQMVFLLPEQRLDSASELARYETHDNHPDDPRYRAFLSRLFDPLVSKLPEGAKGLDYGAGPGPALQAMLNEAGFSTAVYDPFFAPDPAPLAQRYDFVTCTETVEHFYDPAGEFRTFDRLLRPGGWLGVMTDMMEADTKLESWYYLRDPTHVVLYSHRTMAWIAQEFGWSVEHPHPNVALFRKPSHSTVGS
jgi:SAM-dependent methyltransferase